MGKKYEGKIKHTEDSIRQMYKITYNVYHMKRSTGRMIIGMGLVAAGILLEMPMAVQGILFMIGCWLLVSKDFPAKCAADEALEARKKKNLELPAMVTAFFETHAELKGEGRMRLEYKCFERLIEDNQYFYLFLGKDSVCMMEKESIQPKDCEKFKEFVTEKTGLQWRIIKPWFAMTVYEVFKLIRNKY